MYFFLELLHLWFTFSCCGWSHMHTLQSSTFKYTVYTKYSPVLQLIVSPGCCKLVPKNCCSHKDCLVLISGLLLTNQVVNRHWGVSFGWLRWPFLYSMARYSQRSTSADVNPARAQFCQGTLFSTKIKTMFKNGWRSVGPDDHVSITAIFLTQQNWAKIEIMLVRCI